jgi:molecular chaperone DnaK
MEQQTVDFGIDLGTTNSVIARSTAQGVKIIKNRLESDSTPSAVAKTSEGQMYVGQDALDRINLDPARQFKRLMGTTNQTPMHDGEELSPEMLSAEVLKELKAAVQESCDMQPVHVVITVPAMFQQPQCEATRRAAELAGLNAVTLLQEPIAAATAFLNDNPQEGYYLVYDLGGGTFDVSIVRLHAGEMTVVSHGGDNYLGGTDFDREVCDWALSQIENRCGPCPQLKEPPLRVRLTRACEETKKRLSTREEAPIDLGDFQLPIAHLLLKRDDLELIIERHVTRSLTLAQERIDQANLRREDIRSVFLVGGPTKTPYVRRRIKEELGLPICLDQDPMTVVAKGAAIHASSLLNPDRAAAKPTAGQCSASLELFYEPVSPDSRTTVSGRVIEPTGFAGEVRISRMGGDWETGWMPLRNAAFVCEVLLSDREACEFQLSLRDVTGNAWAVTPRTITIRNGIAAARPVAPYDYGVVLEDGQFSAIVKQSHPLPAGTSATYRAAKTVAAGSNEELAIYFLEGLGKAAEDNEKMAELRIRGQDLRRTLHEGEEVQVRIRIDESRLVKVRVSIPLHDLDYDLEFESKIPTPLLTDLENELQEVMQKLNETKDLVIDADEAAFRKGLRELEQIEAGLPLVRRGDAGEAEKVQHQIKLVRAEIAPLCSKYELQAKHRDTMEAIDRAERIARDFEDSIGVATAGDLRADADKWLRLENIRELEAVRERANSIFREHYWETDECWIGWVQFLREERRFASDAFRYDEHLKRAADCLERGDREGVRVHCVAAMAYLPDGRTQESPYSDAGLRK